MANSWTVGGEDRLPCCEAHLELFLGMCQSSLGHKRIDWGIYMIISAVNLCVSRSWCKHSELLLQSSDNNRPIPSGLLHPLHETFISRWGPRNLFPWLVQYSPRWLACHCGPQLYGQYFGYQDTRALHNALGEPGELYLGYGWIWMDMDGYGGIFGGDY